MRNQMLKDLPKIKTLNDDRGSNSNNFHEKPLSAEWVKTSPNWIKAFGIGQSTFLFIVSTIICEILIIFITE